MGWNNIICRNFSFKKEGLDKLLKLILLVSEMKNITTDLNKVAQGVVLEASLDKKKGLQLLLLLCKVF